MSARYIWNKFAVISKPGPVSKEVLDSAKMKYFSFGKDTFNVVLVHTSNPDAVSYEFGTDGVTKYPKLINYDGLGWKDWLSPYHTQVIAQSGAKGATLNLKKGDFFGICYGQGAGSTIEQAESRDTTFYDGAFNIYKSNLNVLVALEDMTVELTERYSNKYYSRGFSAGKFGDTEWGTITEKGESAVKTSGPSQGPYRGPLGPCNTLANISRRCAA